MSDIQSERIISAARELLKAYGYFVDNLWHIDDIHFLCDQGGLARLEVDEAMAVFDMANSQFDGEYGINWPQLERALEKFMQQKTTLNAAFAEIHHP